MGSYRKALILVLLLPALLLACRVAPASSPEQRVRALALARGFAPLEPAPPVRPVLVELGRALAFDKILSGNRDISCMTCHSPRLATADGRRLPIGTGGAGVGPARALGGGDLIGRNTPPLFNLHSQDVLFADGRVAVDAAGTLHTPAAGSLTREHTAVLEFGALSALAMFPVVERSEMRGYGGNELARLPDEDYPGIWAGLMERLGEYPLYRRMFEEAYPAREFGQMTFAHAANAIAGFLVAEFELSDTPWDRFLAGDDDALSKLELAGAQRFLEAACSECHSGPDLADGKFHNVALAQFGPGTERDGDDLGRYRLSANEQDRYAFRTPPLRNVELTAPYGHSGQFERLRDFVAHYGDSAARLRGYSSDGGRLSESLRASLRDNVEAILATRDPLLDGVRFDEATVDQLTAFMKALTDERARRLEAVIPDAVPSGLPVDR